MKLAYIHNTSISSYSANLTQVISMCNAFCNNNVETTLLLPINKQKKGKKEIDEISKNYDLDDRLNIEVFENYTNYNKINKNINFIRLFSCIPKDSDLVFVRSVHYLFVALMLGKRAIYESHNSKVHHGSKIYNWLLSKILISLSRKSNFLLFISISKELNKYWKDRGVDSAKGVSLHDGFDKKKYSNILSKADARSKLKIDGSRPIAVYTGNIHMNRGVNYIIDSAKALRDIDFYIVGGPDYLIKEYNKLYNCDSIDNIFFIGHVPNKDIAIYHSVADLLLAVWSKDVPTINYCSPLKVFEYMASGRPLIAFGYPTIKEVVNHKVNGFICEPDNVLELNKTIKYVVREMNSLSDLTNKSRQLAFEKFSWDSRVQTLLNHLK